MLRFTGSTAEVPRPCVGSWPKGDIFCCNNLRVKKGNSAPLKSGVDKIENRVSDSLVLLDSSLPQTVKEKTHQAYDFVKQALDAAMSVWPMFRGMACMNP